MKQFLYILRIFGSLDKFSQDPQLAPLIVPNQKVTVSASLMRWLKMVEICQLNTGTAGGGVPADTPTLKSVEVRNGG